MKLKIAQHVALHGLVHEAYTASGLTDPAFAAHASATLGFQVNSNHVMQARQTYGIDSLREVRRNATPETVVERVKALEARVATLEAKWADLEGSSVGALKLHVGGKKDGS